MGSQARPSVAFVYGAADRDGTAQADLLARGLGLEQRPAILDWAPAAWNAAAAFGAYLGDDRWAGMAAAEADEALAAQAASSAATAEDLLALPAWIRRLVLRRVSRAIAGSYASISDGVHYLNRGGRIRALVAARLSEWAATAAAPRVVVGLSLGGTILVDVLSELKLAGHAPVELLVTVGAQAPLLYWCDALSVIRPSGAERGEPFAPWLNVWNRDDLLSFQTAGAFAAAGVRDVAVSDDGAFPENHSSYFQNPAVFAAITAAVAALPGG